MSVYSKWVSCMQHIGESCFLFILKVCFLTGVFRPTMFKLILGNWINIYLIFTVSYSLPLFLVSSVIFQSILTFLVLMQHLSYSIFSLFSSGQLLSCVWLFAIPWTAAHQASLSITNSWSLLKLMSIESVMLSNQAHPLQSPSPPAFNLSQHQVFSNESLFFCIRWPKYWSFSFSFSISPSNEYSGLISFRMDWFDFLEVQRTLKSLLQHYSSKASILQHPAFFIVELSHSYVSTEKP